VKLNQKVAYEAGLLKGTGRNLGRAGDEDSILNVFVIILLDQPEPDRLAILVHEKLIKPVEE